MITHHTQLLNALIEKYNLKSYLEIGVQNPANNFDKINVKYKFGCDPEDLRSDIFHGTSDEYFNQKIFIKNKFELIYTNYDLIFIDGYHECKQVKRDFENSLKCLNDNGFIVLHDVLPENEQGTKVPRETKVWWGDVYKFAMNLAGYSDIKYTTYNIDNGCCVIQKTGMSQFCMSKQNYSWEYSWEDYIKYKDFLLNVTDDVVI